ncbi:toxin-antitoxin system YwqK family antitoxin [Gammaproteobacteria bacterium]|nr:toxin-antitoxin system YwqK family antitoxin [Gammaproteobacteria bacterium]
MKKFLSIFCLSILSSFTYGDLVERDGLYYQINSEESFTGIIESYFDSIHFTDNDCSEEDRTDNILNLFGLDYLCLEFGNSKVLKSKTKNKKQRVNIQMRSGDVLKGRKEYRNGKLDGLVESFFENTETFLSGQLREKINYKDGELNGPYEVYYENGQLKEKGNHQDGERDRPYENYYENGQLKEKGNFKDGKRDGLFERYHENGQLELKGNFKEGKEDGLWNYFNQDGELTSTKEWKDGVLQE